MEQIEYWVDSNKYQNRIGISIKYPEAINRKWSEKDISLRCDECNSTEIDTTLEGDMLTLTCLNCTNWWSGPVDKVLTWYESEEATIRLPDQFSEE